MKLTPEGNAIIVCRKCRAEFDKGAPPQDGQNDSTFLCEDCQNKVNADHFKVAAPTLRMDGSATSNDVKLARETQTVSADEVGDVSEVLGK